MNARIAALPPRARGEIRAVFQRSAARTEVARLYETGGLRLRFPRNDSVCEGVIVNTGGGLVGGDVARVDFELGPNACALLTTQSAEKVYGREADAAAVDIALRLGDGATLEWLPQETILFDGARLHRKLSVDLMGSARLTLVEAVAFGRLAMGERITRGSYRDRWRIRRDGNLVFADETKIEGDMATILDRPCCGGGARAGAVLLHAALNADEWLEPLRDCVTADSLTFGATMLPNLLVARFLSPSPLHVRQAIVRALRLLRGKDVPRVWQ